MADQVLSRTLNQKFDTVFEEVTHQESLNLLNRNDLMIINGKKQRQLLCR